MNRRSFLKILGFSPIVTQVQADYTLTEVDNFEEVIDRHYDFEEVIGSFKLDGRTGSVITCDVSQDCDWSPGFVDLKYGSVYIMLVGLGEFDWTLKEVDLTIELDDRTYITKGYMTRKSFDCALFQLEFVCTEFKEIWE